MAAMACSSSSSPLAALRCLARFKAFKARRRRCCNNRIPSRSSGGASGVTGLLGWLGNKTEMAKKDSKGKKNDWTSKKLDAQISSNSWLLCCFDPSFHHLSSLLLISLLPRNDFSGEAHSCRIRPVVSSFHYFHSKGEQKLRGWRLKVEDLLCFPDLMQKNTFFSIDKSPVQQMDGRIER